ncbi:MAG: hypothetical protein M1419_09915, partial [Bacteroidetes bacterium]|nr:hypothetical protein [Bacteroidota bacterium]
MAESINKKKKEMVPSNYKTPKSILILIIVLILFLFQEILFRVIFPIPEVTNFNRINYSPVFFGTNPSELKYLSNASFIWASDPDGVESLINLNLYGFRGNNFCIEPDPDKPRIAFMGDSFVEGYLAKEDETIISNFGKEVKLHGKNYELVNLGIG